MYCWTLSQMIPLIHAANKVRDFFSPPSIPLSTTHSFPFFLFLPSPTSGLTLPTVLGTNKGPFSALVSLYLASVEASPDFG